MHEMNLGKCNKAFSITIRKLAVAFLFLLQAKYKRLGAYKQEFALRKHVCLEEAFAH